MEAYNKTCNHNHILQKAIENAKRNNIKNLWSTHNRNEDEVLSGMVHIRDESPWDLAQRCANL